MILEAIGVELAAFGPINSTAVNTQANLVDVLLDVRNALSALV